VAIEIIVSLDIGERHSRRSALGKRHAFARRVERRRLDVGHLRHINGLRASAQLKARRGATRGSSYRRNDATGAVMFAVGGGNFPFFRRLTTALTSRATTLTCM
jgi:hypothetical protein